YAVQARPFYWANVASKDKKRQEERDRQDRIAFESQNVVSQRQIEIDAISNQLTSLNLVIKEIPSDGHCMYHAVADQLKLTGRLATVTVPATPSSSLTCSHRILTPTDEEVDQFDSYCKRVEESSDWGGQLELRALAQALMSISAARTCPDALRFAPIAARSAMANGIVRFDLSPRLFSTAAPPSATLADIKAHISMMEELTCTGCGIELQFKDEHKVGFCTEKALENLDSVADISTTLLCQRCFQIRNYGKVTDSRMPYEEYEKRVKALKPRDMLMVQLVDILDITGSLLGKYECP
ncbi:hypothetical protein DYB32_000684, partial [Aphanomyces invadans]